MRPIKRVCLLSGLGIVSIALAQTPDETIQQPAMPPVAVPMTTTMAANTSPAPQQVAAPIQITANPLAAPMPAKRIWNLQDADILSVINEVSQETGKNFVVDPRVNGKITLVSTKPLKQAELYQVFLSVLNVLGYAAIPSGNVVKIMPNMDSGEQATRVATADSPGKGDEIVVRVIPLENVSASQLIPILRPMLPQWSNISAYAPGNVIVLLGNAANLDRISKVIADVDKSSTNGIQIVPLQNASALQVANVLNNLQSAARATGEVSPVSIAVDERSNSILLGGPQAMRLRMRVLISQLDTASSTSAGNTEVIYLRYLEAKNLAPLLSKIAANIMGKGSEGAMSYAAGDIKAGTALVMPTDKGNVVTNIQAEPNTNAVIITAPPTLMQALKGVIAKLDIRPAQVMVEAIIAQVEESDLTNLGIQWGSVAPSGEILQSNGTPGSFPNFGAGVVGIMPHVQIQAVLSALRSQNGVDILSTPSIMVLDNQKATIEIGQEVPTQSGSYATTGSNSTVQPFNTIDYKNVTLKLDVTPQINLGSSVRLKLNLKNDTLQNPQNPGVTPLINTSKISNAVMVNSDDVLVLGGLMSNANNASINKVPILSSVPIVGPIFKQKSTSQDKRTLVVFIKPIIFKNEEGAMMITQDKYNEVRAVQSNFTQDLAEIGDKPLPTRLPPWKNKQDLPLPFSGQH